jgi:hypothetical protein
VRRRRRGEKRTCWRGVVVVGLGHRRVGDGKWTDTACLIRRRGYLLRIKGITGVRRWREQSSNGGEEEAGLTEVGPWFHWWLVLV